MSFEINQETLAVVTGLVSLALTYFAPKTLMIKQKLSGVKNIVTLLEDSLADDKLTQAEARKIANALRSFIGK